MKVLPCILLAALIGLEVFAITPQPRYGGGICYIKNIKGSTIFFLVSRSISTNNAIALLYQLHLDSVLLNKRLYYFGGRPSNRNAEPSTLQDLIYLDITNSFSVGKVQAEWQGVQVNDSLTAERNYVYAMGVIPEENSIMIYGGAGSNIIDDLLQHTVLVYNATSNQWQSLPEPQATLKQV